MFGPRGLQAGSIDAPWQKLLLLTMHLAKHVTFANGWWVWHWEFSNLFHWNVIREITSQKLQNISAPFRINWLRRVCLFFWGCLRIIPRAGSLQLRLSVLCRGLVFVRVENDSFLKQQFLCKIVIQMMIYDAIKLFFLALVLYFIYITEEPGIGRSAL